MVPGSFNLRQLWQTSMSYNFSVSPAMKVGGCILWLRALLLAIKAQRVCCNSGSLQSFWISCSYYEVTHWWASFLSLFLIFKCFYISLNSYPYIHALPMFYGWMELDAIINLHRYKNLLRKHLKLCQVHVAIKQWISWIESTVYLLDIIMTTQIIELVRKSDLDSVQCVSGKRFLFLLFQTEGYWNLTMKKRHIKSMLYFMYKTRLFSLPFYAVYFWEKKNIYLWKFSLSFTLQILSDK